MSITLPSAADVETYPDDCTWLAARQSAPHQLGGSDIAAILNRCPPGWDRGPWTLHARAMGLQVGGFSAAQQVDLDRGNRWEQFTVREEWAGVRGYDLHLNGQRCILRDGAHPWATVSPDDVAITERGPTYVEVKTARLAHTAEGGRVIQMVNKEGLWEPSDEIWHLFGPDGSVIEEINDETIKLLPICYTIQILWGMYLAGLEWGCCVYVRPQSGDWPKVSTVWIRAQPEWQAQMFAEVARLRDLYMVQGIAPEPDATGDCSLALAQLYPAPPEKTYRPAEGEVHALALRRAELAAERRRLDREYREAGNRLQAAIGEDYGLTVDTGADKLAKVIAVRTSGRRGVSLSALEQHPDLYAALDERGLITTGSPSVSIRTYGLD